MNELMNREKMVLCWNKNIDGNKHNYN